MLRPHNHILCQFRCLPSRLKIDRPPRPESYRHRMSARLATPGSHRDRPTACKSVSPAMRASGSPRTHRPSWFTPVPKVRHPLGTTDKRPPRCRMALFTAADTTPALVPSESHHGSVLGQLTLSGRGQRFLYRTLLLLRQRTSANYHGQSGPLADRLRAEDLLPFLRKTNLVFSTHAVWGWDLPPRRITCLVIKRKPQS